MEEIVQICVFLPRRLNSLIVETRIAATTARDSWRTCIAARVERAVLSDYREVLLVVVVA